MDYDHYWDGLDDTDYEGGWGPIIESGGWGDDYNGDDSYDPGDMYNDW